jgi:hypothetical protein
MSNNGPTFTKATYDKRRTPPRAPNPGRAEAKFVVDALDSAKSRAIHQKANKVGLAQALGLVPEPRPIKRRV